MTELNKQNHELKRTMKSRHLFMIALGGVIGTGLFNGSGFIISQAGPGGAVLAFIAGGLLMYFVMLCLGELAVAMPVSGSFQEYATKFINPATGFTIGWLYWLSWANTTGLEFTTAGITMQRWLPGIPVWVWCLIFGVTIFTINALSARSYAETEFWFSSIKVSAIVAFIILGGAAMLGIIELKGNEPAPLLSNFIEHGGLFPNGIGAILLTMVTVNYSFQGTELVGIAAGESENPAKTLPRSIRNIIWRTMFFFVLAIFVLVTLIPWQEAGLTKSPFVAVFDRIGIPYAADIMNFVILTAVLSVANSGLYAATRMLWSLSKNSMAPAFLQKLSSRGIPLYALIMTISISGLSLLTSVVAAETVYLWLISISGVITIIVWMSICASQLLFRKQYVANGGKLTDLKFKTPLYPVIPILGFGLYGIILVSLLFIPNQRLGIYCTIPFIIFCYTYYYMKIRKNNNFESENTQKVYNVIEK
ncbi:amino acid permease [Bacillus cytotoxicus]|uniref:Amino acid permease-associated region n=1 Tax=Bacillus cytotoxicus (strain DSM 22905 / CIP 110041 / 391-98 / NVH 391-98) TaxID=315749 RepID=A7GR13_BACCN|nr:MULTISPECIES: amino acid permease [Bacillus cereus group]ABS22571.1 amino acid permease-associated region [Bacillus cytotoxicus NVH 391-98]AWC29222.1 amino acid permease [Bacillus cytotoxicus]AWC41347.1 amino acid permease [Bacillus cytotoxicus]AWC45215.1 amino acid permease [Bacillus cytotoxicus]AWC49278.1 amino acid permease [Bacillus cytotoxicus]